MLHRTTRLVAMGAALSLVAGLLVAASPPTSALAGTSPRTERVKLAEARTPSLRWYRCYGSFECAEAKVPRDYDRPRGATVTVALLKVKARNQRTKLGTLFLNPGGPGGSGVDFAQFAGPVLSRQLGGRYDIVGFDPRGIAFSSQLRCYGSPRRQAPVADVLIRVPFPYTRAERLTYRRASADLGRACSRAGRPLSEAMSTAQVARDLDLLRRAVGDRRLNFLGFSYGSYLGQVYANLFPTRIGRVVIDGVLDPREFAGNGSRSARPLGSRIGAPEASAAALREILRRCDRAGRERCPFAGPNDAPRRFEVIAERLKRRPLVLNDPDTGERFRLGYPELVALTLGLLYSPIGAEYIALVLADLQELTARGGSAADRARTLRRLTASVDQARDREAARRGGLRAGFPYDNSLEAGFGVACSDSKDPRRLSRWSRYAAEAERRARHFGRSWTWSWAACASATWTAEDEDVYRGPWDRRTSRPVLVVGNFWDPATDYAGAVAASRLLPNSRLLSSNSWGHTAYGSSACVTGAVTRYLLRGTLPPRGRVCRGDYQPFEGERLAERRAPSIQDRVVPPMPFAPR